MTWRIGQAMARPGDRVETWAMLRLVIGILSDQLCNCGVVAPFRNRHPSEHAAWCRFRTTLENYQGAFGASEEG